MPIRRLSPAITLLAAVSFSSLVPRAAEAQTSAAALKLACVQASDKAQQLRVAGKLVAARDTLRTCVQDACPSVVREACSQWLGEVNASLPSIVIGAQDSDGKDLLDLKVSIDGVLVTEHLGGRALPIDPGRHKMRYEKPDGTVLEEEILVGEGTKNRPVSVVFPGPKKLAVVTGPVPPPHETSTSKGPSVANTAIGITLAAVGAAALGTALYLDLSATSDVNALKASCGPTRTCSASRVSADELDYDLAGVGLGLGIVAVGIATYVFLGHPFGEPRVDAHAQRGWVPELRLAASPHGGGLALTF
jgi:hypothetical protein